MHGHTETTVKVAHSTTCIRFCLTDDRASDLFESFPLKSTDDQFSSFALRSRIKTQAASDVPLAGIRIVVKDNIHLKGVKTSNGNQAFYDIYPKRRESATCIQSLIDKGAVVVGKTKMSSFAS